VIDCAALAKLAAKAPEYIELEAISIYSSVEVPSYPCSDFYETAHTAVPELLAEVARLRALVERQGLALDSLRHDVDGYDTVFAHASWIADGEPGQFADYCEAYESDDRAARISAIREGVKL